MIGGLIASITLYLIFYGAAWLGIAGGVVAYLIYYFIFKYKDDRKQRKAREKERQDNEIFIQKYNKIVDEITTKKQ